MRPNVYPIIPPFNNPSLRTHSSSHRFPLSRISLALFEGRLHKEALALTSIMILDK